MSIPTMEEARKYGFNFPEGSRWMSPRDKVASDAALTTLPNAGVPAELTQYIDPLVIEVLTKPRRARLLFNEVKKGDWTTSHFKFRVDELVGTTVPYSDYASGGAADSNANWLTREQYRFETTITFGELETAIAATAKMDLVARKQRSAANIIDSDSNKYYLLGVEGKDIYGFLNEPNLPGAVTVSPGASSGKVGWNGKTANEIYQDLLKCHAALVKSTGGIVTQDDDLILALSPDMSALLGKTTDFNVSVKDMILKYLPNLKIVTIPECSSASGETAVMYVPSLMGNPTGELGFGEKFTAHALIQAHSSFSQKFSATTYGCVIYYPIAFSRINGMESAS